MPSNNRNTVSSLPSRTEFSELVDELISLERDYREWEKFKINPKVNRPLLSALAPRRFSSEKEAEEAWSEVHALLAYKKLSQQPQFLSALDSFQRSIKPSQAQKAHFLAGVAFYINRYCIEVERPDLIKQPIASTRKSAAKTARKLRQLAKQGARLEDLQDQGRLDTLLARLVSEMDKNPKKRPKNDETLVERLFVKRLALHFLTLFDEPLTAVVSKLAAVIDYVPDQRNIELIVSEARREHEKESRNAIVKALLAYR